MTRLSWAFVASLCVSTGIHAAVIPLPNGYHQSFGRNNNLEWKNCSLDGLPGRECTRFEVPLDWHDDAAGKGSLFVARYPAIKQPKMGTLFVNPGGPGGSGAEYVQGATADYLMEQSGGAYDIVGWDPRGVGQTIPRVACFDTAEEEVAFWNGTIVENGLDVRGNFTSKADLDAFYGQVNEADDYLQRFAQQCMSHRPGIYRYVGTAATVRDMVAMHDVLEGSNKPIDYWGVSYGTVIGMYFVNMFPDRVGRVVLDGVVDPKDWANRPAHKWLGNALISTDETFDGFAEECIRAGPSACALAEQNATVASIRQLTRDLIDAAYDYRQEVGPSSMLNSFVVRGLIFVRLYSPSVWPTMARGMANLKVALDDPASTNLTEAVLEWLGSAASSAGLRETPLKARQAPDQNQTVPIIDYAFDAISCSDAQDAGNVTTKDVFDYIVSTTHDVSPMFGPIGMPKVARVRCHRWPVRAAERYAGPWNKKLSNRILTIGNEADPITPYINAKNVADSFGSSAVFVKQAGYGHASLSMSSNCTMSILRRYFVHNELPNEDRFCETSTKLFPSGTIAEVK